MIIYNDKNKTYSETRHILNEDVYQMFNFKQDYFDYVVDIGANIGLFSIFAKMNHPNSKVIALEPFNSNFASLKSNCEYLDIETEMLALGNGEALELVENSGGDGDRCVSYRFVELGSGSSMSVMNNLVKSIRLSDLLELKKVDISKNMFIKVDCEGGERHLIDHKKSEDIIRKSKQLSMEIHFPAQRSGAFDYLPTWDVYRDWIYDNFEETHKIQYTNSSKITGNGIYILTNKEI